MLLHLLFPQYGYPRLKTLPNIRAARSALSSRRLRYHLDLANRLIIQEAQKFLGQPIVAVNKPGGGFNIGTAAIATAKPDGYTIGCAGDPAVFAAPHMEKLPYHPVKDFRWIMQFGLQTLGVTVKNDSPYKSFKDLISARSRTQTK